MRRLSLTTLLLTIITFSATAQSGWEWIQTSGGPTAINTAGVYDKGIDLGINQANELVNTGIFRGQGVFDTLTLTGMGSQSIYLTKSDTAGQIIWGKAFYGSEVEPVSLDFDSEDNIYLAGIMHDSIDFGDTILYSTTFFGSEEIFFAKFNTHGDLQWVHQTQPVFSSNAHSPIKVVVDATDHVFLAGAIDGSAQIDTISISQGPGINHSVFIARFDTNGHVQAVQHINDDDINVNDMSTDAAGNLYVGGSFQYNVVINGQWVLGDPTSNIIVIKYLPDFSHEWIKVFDNQQNNTLNTISVSPDNSIAIAGEYDGPLTFDSYTITGDNFYHDLYIACLNDTGGVKWVKGIQSTGVARADDVIHDQWNNFYLTGYYSDTVWFDNQIFGNGTVWDTRQAFISSYHSSGMMNWVDRAGDSTVNYNTEPKAITVDACGSPYITGRMQQSATFGPFTLATYGLDDSFMARYHPAIGLPISGNTQLCLGDTATLIISGANSYTWSPGNLSGDTLQAAPSSTTTYHALANAANGCTYSSSITVQVLPLPNLQVSGNSPICDGDSVTLTAMGAQSYLWLPDSLSSPVYSLSPDSTTTFTLWGADAMGCTNTLQVNVVVNTLPNLSITGDSSICEGEFTWLTAYGADVYTWNPGSITSANFLAQPTSTSTYQLQGTTAQGCSDSMSFTVTVYSLPTPSITGDTLGCQGESFQLTATGGQHYQWNQGDSTATIVESPGSNISYLVTATDINGCSNSTSIAIVVMDTPMLQTISDTSVCINYSIDLTTSGADSYTWYPGNHTGASFSITPGQSTLYWVVGTLQNGCSTTDSVYVVVNLCASTSNLPLNGNGVLYPNPAQESTTLYLGEQLNGPFDIQIIDLNGRMVYQLQNSYDHLHQIYTDDWPAGIYLYTVKSDQDWLIRDRLIVK